MHHVSFIIHYASCIICYASCIICYASCIICYASCIIHYASCIIIYHVSCIIHDSSGIMHHHSLCIMNFPSRNIMHLASCTSNIHHASYMHTCIFYYASFIIMHHIMYKGSLTTHLTLESNEFQLYMLKLNIWLISQTLLICGNQMSKDRPGLWLGKICLTRSSTSPGSSLICLNKYELSKIPDLKDLNFFQPCHVDRSLYNRV